MEKYTYRDVNVVIPTGAEVSKVFLPQSNSPLSAEIQGFLNDLEPWEKGSDPICEYAISRKMGARIVALANDEVPGWAINPNHRARQPQPSPYIALPESDDRNLTDMITFELSGSPEKPMMTRIYPGEYMPPLPWMASARRADGGLRACERFWREHAFIQRRGLPELSTQPPEWFTRLTAS